MEARHLYAIHDFDPAWAALIRDAGVTAWSVISEGIGDDPNDRSGQDYTWLSAFNITPMVRLNFSHHGEGTIPLPDRYDDFAVRCANFVSASPGCRHWIIGNEPNLRGERVNNIPITPAQYADCFARARRAIKQRGSHHQVIVAAIAPYNVDTGPWMEYWKDMLWEIEQRGGADGLALHFNGRGSSPATITSEAKMDSFPQYYNGFRAYRDQLSPAVVPTSMRSLPAYGTETNQLEPWLDANTGWVQAAYAEINDWNNTPGNQKILFLDLYRWKTDDKWHIEGKQGVIDDFKAAIGRGYTSPVRVTNVMPETIFLPTTPNQSSSVVTRGAPRAIDPRATARGVKIEIPPIAPGQDYWFAETIRYYNEQEADRLGPDHYMMIDVLDETGLRLPGIPLLVEWGNGDDEIWTEAKPGEPYSANKPLTPGDFSVRVNDGLPSEKITGVKMGEETEQGFNPGIHTTHGIIFRRRKMAAATRPVPQPNPTPPAKVPMLAHPVPDPKFRFVTQPFGARPEYYSQFSVDGVPLKGHNGIDFGTPEGTPIIAVDDGQVVEAEYDADGYGTYVKIRHSWGESLYAHLSNRITWLGAISKGNLIGLSGNTGNSTGPHLHFGLRVNPFNRADGWGGYIDPTPYLAGQAAPIPITDKKEIVKVVALAALEFGIDSDLLLSQAWAESSFNPNAVSGAGAKGLMQIMDVTWAEWSAKIVAGDNPFDARQNARMGAAYLSWLLRQTQGSEFDALVAYGWGIGNWLNNPNAAPEIWLNYANKIIHGRDLLKAVGA